MDLCQIIEELRQYWGAGIAIEKLEAFCTELEKETRQVSPKSNPSPDFYSAGFGDALRRVIGEGSSTS